MDNKKALLNTIKEEMIRNVHSIGLDNLDIVHKQQDELFAYARFLNNIPKQEELKTNEKKTTTTTKPKPRSFKIKKEKKEKTKEQLNTGMLQRTLANGFIETQDGQRIFVPEFVIRDQDFYHGDIIEFKEKSTTPAGKILYSYKLIKEATIQDETNRQVFVQGYVEKSNDGRLYVKKSAFNERISNVIDGIIEFVIPEHIVEQYQLTVGCTVDLAWYKNNVDSIRVVWKY